MRVLLIDDHALFRHGLSLMLVELSDGIDVSDAESCAEALNFSGKEFDLILLDLNMPGSEGLLDIKRIKAVFASALIVVMSGEDSAQSIRNAIELGAAGFVPKSSSPAIMIHALRLVLNKGIYLPPQVLMSSALVVESPTDEAEKNQTHSGLGHLPEGMTERQTVVLKLALTGLPNKLIARKLDISEGTVKSHLSIAFRIMNVRNRTEALYRAAQLGMQV